MADNTIIQKIVLKIEEYSANIKKINSETKTATDDMNKAVTGNSKVLQQNEEQVKKWGKSTSDELSKVGKQFTENLATGAKAMALDVGRSAIKKAGGDAIAMAFSFSKAFAEIRSRSNASETDLNKWQRSLMQISANVGSNMDSMAESFKDMFSSVKNPDELLKIMDSIGKAAAMGDGDATKVSGFVTSTLKGQGRAVNKANVDDVLGGADLLRRNGSGFKDLDSAMGAMGSIDGQSMKAAKLSDRDLASIIAGATKTGVDTATAVKGVKGLLDVNAAGDLSALGGILGVGSLKDKKGKLDISKLAGATASTMKGKNDTESLTLFKQMTAQAGLSDEAAVATFHMIRNFKDLNETFQKTENDTKSFAQSAQEGADNLEQSYKKFDNTLILGVTDILGGFKKPFQDLLGGKFGSAASGLGGALKQAGSGMLDHPAIVTGAIATTAIAGSLIKSLAPGIFGKAIGGGADLVKGVGIGSALKSAGVTPVYVVNAGDIGKDQSTLPSEIAKIMGGGAGSAAGAVVSKMGFMGKLGLVGAAGAAGYGVGTLANDYLDEQGLQKNKYGQTSSGLERGLAKINPFLSSEDYQDTYGEAKGTAQKVEVEIKLEADGFSARPTSKGMNRDGRTN